MPKKVSQRQFLFCKTPGCNDTVYSIGTMLCHLHYRQEKRRCAKVASREDLEKYFLKHITPIDPESCWVWTGPKLSKKAGGYGNFELHYKNYKAHQVSFYLHNNYWAKDCVLHSCDNVICCNPHHLRDGSHSENMQDARDRNRFARGSKSSNAKLSEETVIKIKEQLKQNISISKIAKGNNVSYVAIFDIRRGRTWSHL